MQIKDIMFKKNKSNSGSTSETTVMKPASALEAPVKEKSRPSLWKSVLVGGVPGIVIGAMSHNTAGMVSGLINPISEAPTPVEGDSDAVVTPAAQVLESHSVSDGMSFSEAFATARAEVGPGGAFVWHGRVYGTFRADDPEWIEMTQEQRAEYADYVVSQVHAAPYTPSEDEPEIIEIPEDYSGEIPDDEVSLEEVREELADEDADVHILGVEIPDTEEPEEEPVAEDEEDGADAVFADTDGDGEVDLVLIEDTPDADVL